MNFIAKYLKYRKERALSLSRMQTFNGETFFYRSINILRWTEMWMSISGNLDNLFGIFDSEKAFRMYWKYWNDILVNFFVDRN